MHRCLSSLLLVTLCLTSCSTNRDSAPGSAVDLAGLDGWVIVVPTNSIPSEIYAAEEFQRFYAEAAGRTLEIVPAAEPKAPGLILIGQSGAALSHASRFKPAQYSPEDLRIVIAPREIVIAGGRPRGTLYGVYTFLEDYLGVRFLTADHTYVPPMPSPCPLAAVNRFFTPPIPWRYTYYGENHDSHEFAARLRQNAIAQEERFGGLSTRRLINHSVSGLLPWSQYGASHPEYFCLRDGKRPAQLMGHQTYELQPCFSNPEARRIMLEAVRAQIKREYPQWKDFSVSQDDNEAYCTCPDCAARDARAGCHTGQLLDFVNWVAGEVAKDYPDVTIGTLIYQWTRTPPLHMKPARNVRLQLCSIECCQIHAIDDTNCPLNRPFQADLSGWAKLTDNIAIWNYNVNFANYLVPCPNLFNLERNVRYFTANHARGIFMQAASGTTGAEFSDLRNYIISNLLWDPSRSGAALMDEFLRLHYGPAAPPVRRFIDRVNAAAQQSGKHRHCFGYAERYGLTAELGAQGIADFKEALALAPNEATRRRVEKASLAAWRLAIEPVTMAPTEGHVLDAGQRAAYRPLVETFIALCRKHDVKLVTEQTRLEDAADMLTALVAEPGAAAAQDQPTGPFAAALQSLLDIIQKPDAPAQLDCALEIARSGAPTGTAHLLFSRLAGDTWHIETTYGDGAVIAQRTPSGAFIHFPRPQTLFLAPGPSPDGTNVFSQAGIEQALARIAPQAATYVRMARSVNGAAGVAILAAARLPPVPGAVTNGVQPFEIRLPGDGGKLVFDVDSASHTFRRVAFQSPKLTVAGQLRFSSPAALPPAPAGVPQATTLPRLELETAMLESLSRVVRAWVARSPQAPTQAGVPAPGGPLADTLTALLLAPAKANAAQSP